MLPVERRDNILKLIATNGVMSIEDLCSNFEVGEMTIRRDLKELHESGYVEKVHGGVRSIRNTDDEPSIGVRQSRNLREKMIIAPEAAKLIEDGDIIFMDAGSTVYEVARHLGNKRDLTVITNGLHTAVELSKYPSCTVIMIGGVIRSKSLSTVGPLALDNLGKLRADKMVISCRGVMEDESISESNLLEIEVKQRMIESSEQVVLVADNSKFNKRSLSNIVPLDKIDIVVTDDGVSSETINKLRERDIKVILSNGN